MPSNLVPNLEFNSYRDHPGSELESTGTGVAGDSGYGTLSQPATQSIASMEPAEYNQDVPASIDFRLTEFNFAPGSIRPTNHFRAEKTDRTKPTKARNLNLKALTCPQCGDVAKCKSEMKKHHLKHVKPYKCDIRNCRRGTRGFTTINDLNRHKKSVHNITVGAATKSYQCASEHCRNRGKIWPRLDNFKQHIHRMHKDENVEDLIRRSLCHESQRSDSPTPQPLSVAPMDTTLAGIGFESFSMPSYTASGAASLTSDQTPQHWGDLDVSHDFEIDDNHPSTNHEYYTSSSQHPDQGMPSGYRQSDNGQSNHMEGNTPSPWRSSSTSTNLGVLADVACNAPPQVSSGSPSAGKLPQRPTALSGEPQTKAEQRKRAVLGEVSKYIATKIPENTEGKSLDKAVWRLLSRATGLDKKDSPLSMNDSNSNLSDNDRSSSSDDSAEGSLETMSKADLVKGLEALAKAIKRDKGHKNLVGQRQRPFSGSNETCPECNKTLPRRCDLKKHMKRHTRPYGCTFPNCKRSFGSKSDWKRHENSQHFQLETWRCQQSKEQSCCAELFYRREVFEEHLKEKHTVIGEEAANEVKSCRIGRNGQGQFWCGFCQKIIPLQNKRSAAWDERFNHIDEHFRDKKDITTWLCLEARKTKEEVMKEMDKNCFDYDDDAGGEDCQDDDSPSASQSIASQHRTPPDGSNTSPILVDGSPARSSNPRKRLLSTDPISSSSSARLPAKRKEIVRYCCQCTLGPYSSKLYTSCLDCEHEFCGDCSRKVVACNLLESNIELNIFAHEN
ncbi:uncharacterized protein BDZ99DRAFT_523400 [Mytilinidion resinicola]|uniref:C2H2-type domain-containing protein n=1 Tax=Mytilinidion resinicola TaxID=574789 RepID=A0A6A6YFN9_9PEZI|nr:uncharacterized protein BDZ99DRAFT_523400 [Mytilinidion resinicola]KAF2806834.1 hypothetical protein BDZ99DRAFT_523400 [Mytilinidion resinicola]